jgi:hypothetical protein
MKESCTITLENKKLLLGAFLMDKILKGIMQRCINDKA